MRQGQYDRRRPLKVEKKLLTLNTIGDTGRSIGVQGKEVEVQMGHHIKGKRHPMFPSKSH